MEERSEEDQVVENLKETDIRDKRDSSINDEQGPDLETTIGVSTTRGSI